MVNRTKLIVAGFSLMFAVVNRLPAQNNTVEVYGGYAYAKANPEVQLPKQSMHGWVGSISGYAASWFGAGVEISAGFGDIPTPGNTPHLNFKEYSYMAGPQFRFVDKAKVQANFKILLGGAFGQVNLPKGLSAADAKTLGDAGYGGFNETKFAALFAVPVDFTLTKTIGLRFEPGLYMTDFSKEKQNNFRFSVGPVFRFGSR